MIEAAANLKYTLLLIIAEYEEHWEGTRKFKVDVSTTINAIDLKEIIVKTVHKSLAETATTLDERKVVVEIYNEQINQFISLDDYKDRNTLMFHIKNRNTSSRKKLIRCQIHNAHSQDSNSNTKMIMGRYFPINDNSVDFANDKLYINEIHNNQSNGTGLNIWDGSMLLLRYIEKNPSIIKEKKILELGSGIGMIGIACSILGAKLVVMTDLEYTIANMKYNIQLNKSRLQANNIQCHVCNWFHPCPITNFPFYNDNLNSMDGAAINDTDTSSSSTTRIDLILVADCIWVEELVQPFLSTLKLYCNSVPATTKTTSTIPIVMNVIISYQRRSNFVHQLFWNGLHEIFDEVVQIPTNQFLDSELPDKFYLLDCRRNL